jgi:hypothetical protein
MAVLLRNVPIVEQETTVKVRGKGIPILENQLVGWVAIRPKGIELPPLVTDAYLPGHGTPRLPLLGLNALLTNRLRLTVDGANRRFSLR